MYSESFNNLTRDYNQKSRTDTSPFERQKDFNSNSKFFSLNSKPPVNNRRSYMVINNQLVIIYFLIIFNYDFCQRILNVSIQVDHNRDRRNEYDEFRIADKNPQTKDATKDDAIFMCEGELFFVKTKNEATF